MELLLGDKTKLKVGKENRDWGYNPGPDGTEVEVVGFSEIHYSRLQCYTGQKPGVYENHSWPMVRLPDGQEIAIWAGHLEHTPEQMARPSFQHYFLRDLPETDIWEFDEIEVPTKMAHPVHNGYYKNVFVIRIQYDNIGRLCNDGKTPMPMYDLSTDIYGSTGYTWDHEPAVLKNRGLMWKYFHNEPMDFADIKQEVWFFNRIHEYKEVRNPANEMYKWSDDEIKAGIKSGIIDVRHGQSAIKFNNPELSQKCRDNDIYAIM